MAKFTVSLDVVDVEAAGKVSTVQMVKQAVERGLDEVGLSFKSVDVQAVTDDGPSKDTLG